MLEFFIAVTAVCELWHQVREPLVAFFQAAGI